MKNKKAILVILLFFVFLTYAISEEFFHTSSYKVNHNEKRNPKDGTLLGYDLSTAVDYFKIQFNEMDYLIITNVRGGVNYINLTKDKAELEYYKRTKK